MPEEYSPLLRALRRRRSALRSMRELARWRAKPKDKMKSRRGPGAFQGLVSSRAFGCVERSQAFVMMSQVPEPKEPKVPMVRARAPLGPACARSHRAPLSARIFSSREQASHSAAAWHATRMMLNSDRRIQHFIERASAWKC